MILIILTFSSLKLITCTYCRSVPSKSYNIGHKCSKTEEGYWFMNHCTCLGYIFFYLRNDFFSSTKVLEWHTTLQGLVTCHPVSFWELSKPYFNNISGVSGVVQWVEDPALPQLWHRLQLQLRFSPWRKNYHMLWIQTKKIFC